MALFEYYCETCRFQFEEISSSISSEDGKCPKCHGKNTKKLISRFSVGGQGDLRESTLHGCHGCSHSDGESHGGAASSS